MLSARTGWTKMSGLKCPFGWTRLVLLRGSGARDWGMGCADGVGTLSPQEWPDPQTHCLPSFLPSLWSLSSSFSSTFSALLVFPL